MRSYEIYIRIYIYIYVYGIYKKAQELRCQRDHLKFWCYFRKLYWRCPFFGSMDTCSSRSTPGKLPRPPRNPWFTVARWMGFTRRYGMDSSYHCCHGIIQWPTDHVSPQILKITSHLHFRGPPPTLGLKGPRIANVAAFPFCFVMLGLVFDGFWNGLGHCFCTFFCETKASRGALYSKTNLYRPI